MNRELLLMKNTLGIFDTFRSETHICTLCFTIWYRSEGNCGNTSTGSRLEATILWLITFSFWGPMGMGFSVVSIAIANSNGWVKVSDRLWARKEGRAIGTRLACHRWRGGTMVARLGIRVVQCSRACTVPMTFHVLPRRAGDLSAHKAPAETQRPIRWIICDEKRETIMLLNLFNSVWTQTHFIPLIMHNTTQIKPHRNRGVTKQHTSCIHIKIWYAI